MLGSLAAPPWLKKACSGRPHRVVGHDARREFLARVNTVWPFIDGLAPRRPGF